MLEKLFRLILISSIYSSIAGAIILLLKVILKNKINPKWHYIIWMVLIIKLIIPFGPESVVSLFNTMPEISEQGAFTQRYEEYREAYEAVRETENTNTAISLRKHNSSLKLAANAEKALPYIWLLGAAAMLSWLMLANCSLNRKIKKSLFPVPRAVNDILEACKEKSGVKKNIPIVMQNIISTPALFDPFNPKILLSENIAKLSNKELSYILLHELAHYKRKDLITNHILLLLQVIHWFNPIIWYCFKVMRNDMEAAADEQVLTLLEHGEHREYGRALLSVIENLRLSRLAPRLIGMVDNKKNIERRIKMIKMMNFFSNRRRATLIIGVLCVAVLSGILLTNGLTKDYSAEAQGENINEVKQYDAVELIKYKTAYVGDNSSVVNLLSCLSFGNLHSSVSLKTDQKPYRISAEYNLKLSSLSIEAIDAALRRNAVIIFALIDNVDEVSFKCNFIDKEMSRLYTREQLQKDYTKDLREYAKDKKEFEGLLDSFSLSLLVYPERYTLVMSSTPGIRITADYNGIADTVEYSAGSGRLLTWDNDTGKINEYGQKARLSLDTPIYWSPLTYEADKEINEVTIKVTVLNNEAIAVQGQVDIAFDPETYFYSPIIFDNVILADTSINQVQKPKSIDEAVSLAVKEQRSSYADGEAYTEGHIILETETKDEIIKVYTFASYGAFGFENGIFTKISGSGSIPTVITFKRNLDSEYELIEYKEPLDGAGYNASIKELFPRRLWDTVLSQKQDNYSALAKQQKEQAEEYLKSIGRKAEVSEKHVEKKLVNIDVEASNKLFSEYTKNDAELNNFPYWIGTKELVQKGIRYIYETSQSKSKDGYDVVSFKKTEENGTIIKQFSYKIVGHEPQLLQEYLQE